MGDNINALQEKWYNFSQKIAEEGIVLLKNENNVLPLLNKKAAIFGAAQMENFRSDESDLYLINELEKNGINFDRELANDYKSWAESNSKDRTFRTNIMVQNEFDEEMPIAEAVFEGVLSGGAETAMIVIRRSSSENCDMTAEKGDYLLSDSEEKLIKAVCGHFKDVILLLKIGCCIDLSFLDDNKINAVIYTNSFGNGTAAALARILKGEVNPSGKLTYTMAKRISDYPSSANFGQHGGGLIQDYKEDIFVGYRYFKTFGSENVVFPFGHGLSYTNFKLDNIRFEKSDKIYVELNVTNTGKYAGKEVVQLYCSAPQLSDGAVLGKPLMELCGFEKTRLLAPGESETLRFEVDPDELASYDDTGALGEKSVFVSEKGAYNFFIGNSIENVTLAGGYTQKENRIIRKCSNIATALPERLSADGTYERLPVNSAGNLYTAISPLEKTKVDVHGIAKLSKGESLDLKLFPGVGGGYALTFSGSDGSKPVTELAEIRIDGIKIKLAPAANSQYVISLPLRICDLKLTALCDNPGIESLYFEKIDTTVTVDGDKPTVIKCSNYYEGSFYLEVSNYEDEVLNTSDSYITNFFISGMYAIYKLYVPQGGAYDISFKYSYNAETVAVNNVMTVAVSNIVQPLGTMKFENTYLPNGKRRFKNTDFSTIELPKGYVYLKIISADIPFPDISEVILSKSSGKTVKAENITDEARDKKDKEAAPGMLEPDNGIRSGIILRDVYDNPELMRPFLEQLSDEELAVIVSGTSLNRTPYGDVGCNHPLYLRGVPAAQTADGPCGLRQQGLNPTRYPMSVILASSFNKGLYSEYGEIMGEECRLYGVDLWLAPSINIFRNPLGGRNNSYASEDPYLSGIFASEQIKSIQKCGVGAVLKHYCANSTEYERLKSNSRVSERALREIYMKGFEIAVKKADPWAIMSSYNSVNDTKVCENRTLITEIPRKEWNWDGVFVTDWWNDSNHIKELKAGHDLKMATGDISGVAKALNEGILTREEVYVCAGRVLKMLLKLETVREFIAKEGA